MLLRVHLKEDRHIYRIDNLPHQKVLADALHVSYKAHRTSQRALPGSTSITVMFATARALRNTALVSVATMDGNVLSSTLLVRSETSK